MEITAFFQSLMVERVEQSMEISSPNNEKYKDEIEKLESKISEIQVQQLKAYQEAEEILIC